MEVPEDELDPNLFSQRKLPETKAIIKRNEIISKHQSMVSKQTMTPPIKKKAKRARLQTRKPNALKKKFMQGCNFIKVVMILTVYLYIHVHIVWSIFLHDESIKIMNEAEVSESTKQRWPGEFFPTKCDDSYQHNCARVAFEECREKNTSSFLQCKLQLNCEPMSSAFSDGAHLGFNVSMFFNSTLREVKYQINFCGEINYGP